MNVGILIMTSNAKDQYPNIGPGFSFTLVLVHIPPFFQKIGGQIVNQIPLLKLIYTRRLVIRLWRANSELFQKSVICVVRKVVLVFTSVISVYRSIISVFRSIISVFKSIISVLKSIISVLNVSYRVKILMPSPLIKGRQTSTYLYRIFFCRSCVAQK